MSCSGSESTRRLCFQLMGGGYHFSLPWLFCLNRYWSDEVIRCLPQKPDAVFKAELDFCDGVEQTHSNGLSNHSTVPASAGLSHSFPSLADAAAPNPESFDLVIRQRLKPSGSVTIIEHFTWSDDMNQVEQERHDWLKKGTVGMRMSLL